MIIKASQRGGGRALAAHLMNAQDNEHVELHEVRGFVSSDLRGAFMEVEAAAKATKCKQHFFSVSLSPPETENVRPEVFELAARRIEDEMGLEGQPMALVFHEKQGRRHAHAVWSRIDTEQTRAINLPHFKRKLNEISRGLFIEHGWQLPDGYKRGREKSPLNFTLAEWQQARRAGKGAKEIKATIQECWNASENAQSFKGLLEERGYYLAQGDRRGFVAVDYQGEVYAIPRMTGLRAKAVREYLGEPSLLPTVAKTKTRVSGLMKSVLKRHIAALEKERDDRVEPLMQFRREMRTAHRVARKTLDTLHKERWATEAKARQNRFSKGLRGVWDWLRGKHSSVRKRNEMEVAFKRERDRKERQDLVKLQLADRRALQSEIHAERERHADDLAELYRELAQTRTMARESQQQDRPRRQRPSRRQRNGPSNGRERSNERTLDP